MRSSPWSRLVFVLLNLLFLIGAVKASASTLDALLREDEGSPMLRAGNQHAVLGNRELQVRLPTRKPIASPTPSPLTSFPSPNPTTTFPSKIPTTSFPSKIPTESPPTKAPTTSFPSRVPSTQRPSRSPIRKPTRSPVPTRAPPPTRPTTFRPSKSPTQEPTGRPTASPTERPTRPTRMPTTASPTSERPSPAPTTATPSASPSVSAPTHSPTTTKPSQTPTTTRPSRAPSTPRPSPNPTTSRPSRAPIATMRPTSQPKAGLIMRRSDAGFLYVADPQAIVVGDTIYLFCSTDPPNAGSSTQWTTMREYTLLTTTSMEANVPWTNHGVVLRPNTRFPTLAYLQRKMMFAPAAVYYQGWFYLYFPYLREQDGQVDVGAARARDPRNPSSWELVIGIMPVSNLFDPAVMVAPDGRMYLYGNSRQPGEGPIDKRMLGAELDRTTMSGPIRPLALIYGGFITEAVFAFWRRFFDPTVGREVVKYYFMARSQRNGRDCLQYWIADTPLPFINRADQGLRLTWNQYDAPAHASVIEYKSRFYFFYHSGVENNGNKWRRSTCVDEMFFEPNGQIVAPMKLTCATQTRK